MNVGKHILVWVFILVIMAKEVGKAVGKAKWNFWKFIYENNEN